MYPRPCGYHADPGRECTCSLTQVLRYQKRISGPLLDRIDIHPLRSAWGSATSTCCGWTKKLSGDRLGEASATIQMRLERARARQRLHFAGTRPLCNENMGPVEVRQHCGLDEAGKRLLRPAMQQMQMSARAFHRILKLARTMAHLADCEEIDTPPWARRVVESSSRRVVE